MRGLGGVRFLTAVALIGLLPLSSARAEETKGKWQFGFGLSYFSTIDYIRSNADVAFASTLAGPSGLPQVGNVDPRPDIDLLNQPSIADDFRLDLNASYGLTRWLAVELATSYQQSAVGNIEFYTSDSRQPLGNPIPSDLRICGPGQSAPCEHYTPGQLDTRITNDFVHVGQITEVPVQLSGLIRFREGSPFDPYMGLGVGYIFTRFNQADELRQTSAQLASLRVSVASEGEYTSSTRITKIDTCGNPPCPGFVPKPLEATLRDAFEWHAVGGVDYFVNHHFSFYIDARYAWTSGALDIKADGAHQVQFGVADNGQLILKQRLYAGQVDPLTGDGDPSSGPYLWEDVGPRNPNLRPGDPGYGQSLPCQYFDPKKNVMVSCAGDGLLETEDKNLNGLLDVNPEHVVSDPRCVSAGYPLNHNSEDDGCIYVFPPGPMPTIRQPDGSLGFDPSSRFDDLTFICDVCKGNDSIHASDLTRRLSPDSEDQNYNVFMDRFLTYGVDICTTAAGVGDPRCSNSATRYDPTRPPTYVFPEGCSLNRPDPLAPPFRGEGCPSPPNPSVIPTTTGEDNVADVYLLQGGRIRLGGFGLGFGFKFTF